ncbi:MAG: prepilin-type N-terminal cleavage/methylation domain-containing protein [Armatimonadetes bacterium]|nr:prepilin-type N-terminal cleavage/methylation domain-containing protein [Armatimonadota bacterium]
MSGVPSSVPRGFTLVELMVVLVILVLLAGLTAPSFARQYHVAKLRSAARDLVGLMQYARSQAVVEGTTYRLNVDRDGGRVWVTYYDTETAEARDEEPKFVEDESVLGASRKLPAGVTICELQLGDEALAQLSEEALEEIEGLQSRLNEEGTPFIAFAPSGTSDGARILLENEYEDQLAVAVDAITGRTEVREEDELAAG